MEEDLFVFRHKWSLSPYRGDLENLSKTDERRFLATFPGFSPEGGGLGASYFHPNSIQHVLRIFRFLGDQPPEKQVDDLHGTIDFIEQNRCIHFSENF